METSEAVAKAFAIRDFYNNLCIGHDDAPDCRSLVGPGPFLLSSAETQMLIDQGQTLRRWFEITLHLCHKAYSQNNLAWLAEVIEGGLPIQVKKIHRLPHPGGGR